MNPDQRSTYQAQLKQNKKRKGQAGVKKAFEGKRRHSHSSSDDFFQSDDDEAGDENVPPKKSRPPASTPGGLSSTGRISDPGGLVLFGPQAPAGSSLMTVVDGMQVTPDSLLSAAMKSLQSLTQPPAPTGLTFEEQSAILDKQIELEKLKLTSREASKNNE